MLFFLFKKEEGREEEDLNSQNFLLMQVGTHNYSGSSYMMIICHGIFWVTDGSHLKCAQLKRGKNSREAI